VDSGTLIAGRYRLDRIIASGGMGAVWRADDGRLERTVAVKVLHAGLDGSQRPRERFESEAKILAKLKGPGCVEVYDFGEQQDGDRTVLFLVMELVEGMSLAELLHREKRLDPARTMRFMAEAAEALAGAHRAGVVHRDIKPGNILIDADDRVKVVDFGISLFANRSRLTPSGDVLGTAPYVSPEQLRDKGVTGSSDLYSLGAVAYECLAGTPPFNAEDPAAVIHGHLYTEPPALPGDVPVEVAGIVSRSLRKTPEARWESGEILAAAARAATTGQHPIEGSVGSSANATTADVPATARPPFLPRAEPPVAPPARPATVEPPEDGPLKRRRMVLVGIAVAAVLTVFAVVAWSPWTGDGGVSAGDDTSATTEAGATTGEPSPTASSEPSETPSETPTDEETTADSGEDSDAGDDTGGEENTNNDTVKEGSGEVPDVKGKTTFEARDYLNELGFSNVVATSGMWYGYPEPEHCQVMSQTPNAGQTIDYTERIDLSYHYRDSVGTTCEW
jgi:serine/threonine-protein kinase